MAKTHRCQTWMLQPFSKLGKRLHLACSMSVDDRLTRALLVHCFAGHCCLKPQISLVQLRVTNLI